MKRYFYELQTFYFRDVYFGYSNKNKMPYFDLQQQSQRPTEPFYYEVDVLDKDVNQYGVLPTIGPLLINNGIKEEIAELCNNLVIFYDAAITDSNENENHEFSIIIVKNEIPCLDIIHSETYLRKYRNGSSLLKIKKLVLDASKINASNIFTLDGKSSYIIVSDAFKTRFSSVKGFHLTFILTTNNT